MKSPNLKNLATGILAALVISPFLTASHHESAVPPEDRARMVVLTDMGADPDDEQSLVRLLLYANQIDIEGIVATTSCWHQNSIRPDFIHKIVDAYGEVQPNLLQHEPGFPTADAIRAIVKEGIPKYGMTGVGDGMDTEGSDWIIQLLDNDDPRPLWISVWGGPNTLAQALYTLRQTRPAAEVERLVAKLRVYTISDQDDSAMWMRREFPGLFYIVTPGDDYGQSTWVAINNVHDGIDNSSISNPWLAEHIQQGHGPLGAVYPDVAWGVEGDTPAYLGLIPNGLNVPDRPDFGGWGGRYELSSPDFDSIGEGGSVVVKQPETRPIWTNADDTYRPFRPSLQKRAIEKSDQEFTGNQVTLWRWRDDFQNDFAARMDWCTQTYAEANHAPVIKLNHPTEITVPSGGSINFDAYGSYDPDGDSISYLWFHYPEAGTYDGGVLATGGAENFDRYHVGAPEVDEAVTAHFILKITDKGTPALSSYQRIIVTIRP